MQYTKGEWVADIRMGMVAVHLNDPERFRCLSGMDGACIHVKHGKRDESSGCWPPSAEEVANAHLMAAGPEMYEELQLADEIICNLCKRLNPQHENCTSCEERVHRLKALAKAEGKEG